VVASNLAFLLSANVRKLRAGQVFSDGAGYQLLDLPNTVRVEVLSPSETASALEEKLDDYGACGTPLIWVVDPTRRTVMIVASDAPVRWLREEDTLDGGGVLPGFACAVADLFEGVAR
jgi:Uma2 family endonuclease